MNTKQSFQISYDGPSLANHEMDVRELAPALIAVSDLLEETNKVVFQGKTQVQVNVRGSFKSGSFNVDFMLSQDIIKQVSDLFGISRDASAQMILQIIGIPTICGIGSASIKITKMGLIQFIKWLRNRRIKKIEKIDEQGSLTITVEDEQIETYQEVIDLYRNVRVRKSLEQIIHKPLSNEGIDTFIFRGESSTQVEIRKQESDLFETPIIEEEHLDDEVYETDVQLMQVSFKEGIKWKFTDGSAEFLASVADTDFLKKVQESKESFSKDDILKVLIRKKKWIGSSGIHADYEIEKVISHRPSAQQIPLFMGE